MATKRKFKSAAVQELYEELIGDDAAAQEEFEEGLVNIEAAHGAQGCNGAEPAPGA